MLLEAVVEDELLPPVKCDLKFAVSFDSVRSGFLLPFIRNLQLNVRDLEIVDELEETPEVLVEPFFHGWIQKQTVRKRMSKLALTLMMRYKWKNKLTYQLLTLEAGLN